LVSPIIINEKKSALTFQLFEVILLNDGTEIVNSALGCRLDTLTISGSGNDLMKFSVSGVCAAVKKNDVTVYTDLPTFDNIDLVCGAIKFSDLAITGDIYTNINSFDLTLNSVFTSDENKYQNNAVAVRETVLKQTGELSLTGLYDSTSTRSYAELYADGSSEISITIPTIATMVMNLQITDYDHPDSGQDIMVETINARLVSNSIDEAIVITIL